MVEGGKTEKKRPTIARLLKERRRCRHPRARGLVAGFARQGVELGGFKRYEEIQAETPERFRGSKKRNPTQGRIKECVTPPRSRRRSSESQRGGQDQDVELELEKAKGRVVTPGDMAKAGVGKIARGATGQFTACRARAANGQRRALDDLKQSAAAMAHERQRGEKSHDDSNSATAVTSVTER